MLIVLSTAGYATYAMYNLEADLTPSTIAIALGAFVCLYRFCQVSRVTQRGEAYLAALRQQALTPRDNGVTIDPATRAATIMALFGWNRLHDPDDAEFRNLVQLSGAGTGYPAWRDAASQRYTPG
jgi:hypothetical protein